MDRTNPTLLVAHLHFANRTKPNKNAKELPSQRTAETENRTTENALPTTGSLAKWRI